MVRSNSESLPTKCLIVAATPFALHAADVGDRDLGREQRILRVALEVPAVERRAVDVDRRREQDAGTFRERLLGERLADLLDQRGFQVAASAMPTGKHAARSPPTRLPPPRAPFGPSVTLIAGMPSRSIGTVVQKSAPASREACSSKVIARNRSWMRSSVIGAGRSRCGQATRVRAARRPRARTARCAAGRG